MNNEPFNEDDNLEKQQELRQEEEAYKLHKRERELKAQKRATTFRWIVNTIYVLVGFLQVLLFIRFMLRLLGANPENQFAQFIYSVSDPFISPFATLFISPVSDETMNPIGGMNVFDLNVIVAIIVYALLGWLGVTIVRYLYKRP
ncbi:YggT family protein [Cyanobacterium stanieri LEGE 03274]|uniref:YggT family protein n=1 Tax=Cyanobacterium stanieri LEGE 03274 TaxID=1828756 RepID=A0ABR9V7K4_9CHRO|nr:YggT family protein [Cyanobacterium stanieri]MBE9223509.1 YggT family protein [Cyanobacterium stanieri LEGE 03274]